MYLRLIDFKKCLSTHNIPSFAYVWLLVCFYIRGLQAIKTFASKPAMFCHTNGVIIRLIFFSLTDLIISVTRHLVFVKGTKMLTPNETFTSFFQKFQWVTIKTVRHLWGARWSLEGSHPACATVWPSMVELVEFNIFMPREKWNRDFALSTMTYYSSPRLMRRNP